MLRNYGTEAGRVLELAEREPALARAFTGSHVSFAEAVYAVRAEMALRMNDVVFRRTELGTDGHPGAAALDELQALLGRELGWSEQRRAEERSLVERHLERYLAAAPGQTAERPQPLSPQPIQHARSA
jgi:glycerol-3-phosphate dehydrogenase